MNIQEFINDALKVAACATAALFLMAMSFIGIIQDWYSKQVEKGED